MPTGNLLLATIPTSDRDRFLPGLIAKALSKGEILFDVGEEVREAYFPTAGLISLVAVTRHDHAIELDMVGREGFIGLPLLLDGTRLPYQVVVQIPGAALAIRRDALRAAFQHVPAFRRGLLANARARHAQVCRAVMCHRFHPLRARLSRWLLSASDRLESNTVPSTQEALAYLLNAPRTAVTAAALALHAHGLIHYRHGTITITNRGGLAAWACPCYRVDKVTRQPLRSSG